MFFRDFNTDEGTMGAGLFYGAVNDKHESRSIITLERKDLVTHVNSTGSSAATSYLRPEVLERPNLTVGVSVYTERILFASGVGGSVKAIGVQASTGRNAPKYAVCARREVLVCGGVFGSPQLLLLSGVGPSAQLQKLKIPVVRDLPAVGRGLLDVRVNLSFPQTTFQKLSCIHDSICVPEL